MTRTKVTDEPTDSTLDEIRAAAERASLPFTEAQIEKVHTAVVSMRESAARLRQGLARNDEPAFGFVPPSPQSTKR